MKVMSVNAWRFGLAALAAAVVAPCCAVADEPSPESPAVVEPVSAKDVIAKAEAFMKGAQKESGAWSDENYPALTALGVWGLMDSEDPAIKEVAAKAVEFVARFAQEDGGIYKKPTGGRGTGGLSTYNTAICMMVLNRYDSRKYAPIVLKAREFVASSQLVGDSPASGGFGYNRPGESRMDRPDLSNTGWAMMAMHETQAVEDLRPAGEKRVDINWESALKYVEQMQVLESDDPKKVGGFGYEMGGERGGFDKAPPADGAQAKKPVMLNGFGSMTYAGLEAMIYADVSRDDPRVRSAITWAGNNWSVEENPGMGKKGLFYYYTIMAKSLTLAGEGDLRDGAGNAIDWKMQLLAELASGQKEDGSWINSDNMFWESDPALVTAYSLVVLRYIGK